MESDNIDTRPLAVRLSDVSVMFNLNIEKVDSLKEAFIKFIKGKLQFQEFWALQNISMEVKKGDRVGILGLNGAGKSTLLKVIAGVYKPTKGKVFRNGLIAPMIEVGAGFDPQYTARENIYLYGAVLGYDKKFIQGKFNEIIEFSELQDFIDVPLKNYSSGMRARLGFAVCTAVDPDILILDEVLSVGDARFRQKSMARIQSMFDSGVTVFFVSHNAEQVKTICNKGILLDHGKMIASGEVNDVVEEYNKLIASRG